MAKYNEILVGRFARFLQKLTSIKGEVPASQLAGEIMPVIPFLNGVENRFIDGWDRFSIAVVVTAVAAQPSNALWRNAANSNVLAVIEQIILFNIDIAQNYQVVYGPATADLGTIDTFSTLQLDVRGRKSSSMILSHQNAALGAGLPPNVIARVPLAATNGTFANLINNENQELPMAPGTGLLIGSFSNNTRVDAVVTWRERFLEDSERA